MIEGLAIFLAGLTGAGLLIIGLAVVFDHFRWKRIQRAMARGAQAPVPGRPRLGIDREAGPR